MVATYWNSAHRIIDSNPPGSQCKHVFFHNLPSICIASLFPPCLWEKMIRKKNFPHRQGWNRELTHIVVGSLLLIACCLLAACLLLVFCLLAGCWLAACWLLAVACLLAACWLLACCLLTSFPHRQGVAYHNACCFPVSCSLLAYGIFFLPNQKNIPSAGREPGSKTHWGRGLPSYGKRCSS